MNVRDIVCSLYSICLNKTAELLKGNYWHEDMPENPFEKFPPTIVEDLISCVCTKSASCLHSSSLALLLKSGRVANLKLHDTFLTIKNADKIFYSVYHYRNKLKTIRIRNIEVNFGVFVPENYRRLLKRSKLLIYLETCIRFRINNVKRCRSLQKLVLDFNFFDSFILRSWEKSVFNRSVRVITVACLQRNRYIHHNISSVLHHFTELIELDYEVSRAIEYLHKKKEATRYKLLKTLLGNDKGATSEGIRLTSIYCPDLVEICVSPKDYSAIHALSNFRHITVLTICEPTTWVNDYRLGIHPLLENSHIGHNLKSLTIIRFLRVCLASIGAFCPNLENFVLILITEDNKINFAPNSYKKLRSLSVEMDNNEPCKRSSLIGLLSNASVLEFLTIKNASRFNDPVLNYILRNKAVFTVLRVVNIPHCGLTINGLQEFAQRLSPFTHFSMCSSIIEEEDAKEVLESSNVLHFRWSTM